MSCANSGCSRRCSAASIAMGLPPEQPVVDQDELGPLGGRALEQLHARGDPGDDRSDLLRTGHLEAVRAVVLEPLRLEQIVEVSN